MKQKIKTILITAVLTGLTVYLILNIFDLFGEKKMKISYPFTRDVSEQISFACEALMSAGVIGSPKDYLIGGIEGNINKGTDKVAIKIKDEKTLSFITGAAVESGISEGEPFVILKNNKNELVAIYFNEILGGIDTFSLNKKNGLAVWAKTKPEFPGYESPYGDIIYLICR